MNILSKNHPVVLVKIEYYILYVKKFDDPIEKVSFKNIDTCVELYFEIEVFDACMIVDNAHISFVNEKFAIIDNHNNNIVMSFEKCILKYDIDYIIRIILFIANIIIC